MTSVIALGQSAHYIQAWKIFVTQSASDMSLLSYSIYFTLLLHAFGCSIVDSLPPEGGSSNLRLEAD